MDHAPGGALSAGISRSSRKQHNFLEVCRTPELAKFPAALPHPGRGRGHRLFGHSDFGRGYGPAFRTYRQRAHHSLAASNRRAVNETLDRKRSRLSHGSDSHAQPRIVLGFAAAMDARVLHDPGPRQGWVSRRESSAALGSRIVPVAAGSHCARPRRCTCARESRRARVQLVQLFDTWAGELAPREYRAFALPATQLLRSAKWTLR